jgi:hypothetical protein
MPVIKTIRCCFVHFSSKGYVIWVWDILEDRYLYVNEDLSEYDPE